MQKVALFGIGPEADTVIHELRSLYWSVVQIESVFYNDSSRWGESIFLDIEIERPSDIARHFFEKLIICGTPDYTEPIVPILVEKLGLDEGRVIPYHKWIRCNIGKHEIDWEQVSKASDIINGLRHCGTLNDLEDFYYNHPHRPVGKLLHYFDIYDKYFQKYRNKECVIVEVGICKGGSLQMWKSYFGQQAKIIGIDIDESTLSFEEEQVSVEIGSQSDRAFWSKFKEKYPKVDIFIDDGGHTMDQQIITFTEMFPHIAENGIYLCEDLHTSYWANFGGGYKKPTTFIEFSKNFVDCINAWYHFDLDQDHIYTRSMHSLHYYDSMLVIEKERAYPGVCITMGEEPTV